MYVVDGRDTEEHFTEGEPDLEPPEELAVGELDDDVLLEEDLDSEIVLEEDVDEDVLEATLEDLAHLADDEDVDDSPEKPMGSPADLEDLDADTLDIADVEESLDRILRERLAQEDDGTDEDDVDDDGGLTSPAVPVRIPVDELEVQRCRETEFVCRGCFLVRSRVQLADAVGQLCHDCAG